MGGIGVWWGLSVCHIYTWITLASFPRGDNCLALGSVGALSDTSTCLLYLILLLVSSLCRAQMKSSDIDQELFTESYCKVCSAQLISESQRVAHYEVGCSCSATPPLHLCLGDSAFEELFFLVASYPGSDVTAAVSAARLACSSLSAKSACNLIGTEGSTVSKGEQLRVQQNKLRLY